METTPPAPATPAAPQATAAATVESPAGASPSAAFERRTVIVPDHEQLKPESVIRGVVEDIVTERPWLPWVLIALLVGYLLGRSRR